MCYTYRFLIAATTACVNGEDDVLDILVAVPKRLLKIVEYIALGSDATLKFCRPSGIWQGYQAVRFSSRCLFALFAKMTTIDYKTDDNATRTKYSITRTYGDK